MFVMLPTYLCVVTGVELILLSFHISVTILLTRQLARRSRIFLSGFYVIYVLQSFADIVNYLLVWMAWRKRAFKHGDSTIIEGSKSSDK